MDETTGLFMRHMMGTEGMTGMKLGFIAVAVVAKLVVSFLFVWLCVYLMHRWQLKPFNKKHK